VNRRAFLQAMGAVAMGTRYPIYRAALPAPGTVAPPVAEPVAQANANANFYWFVSGAWKYGVPPPHGPVPPWFRDVRRNDETQYGVR
jgi:hypothetical protein